MIRVRLGGLLLVAFCLALSACSNNTPVPVNKKGVSGSETVRGKVTYKGQPVPYGFVLFFNDASRDRKTGMFTPISGGIIGEDGSYEVVRLPPGGVKITVLTNPDVDPALMLRPAMMGEDPSEPPIRGKPPVRRVTPEEGPPEASRLTEAQKKELRVIHSKYCAYAPNSPSYTVQPGEQTFDIELK